MELIIVLANDPREQSDLEPVLAEIGQLSVASGGHLILRTAHFGPDAVRHGEVDVLESVRSDVRTLLRAINGAIEIEPGPTCRIDITEWRYVDATGTERIMPPSAPTNLSITLLSEQPSPSLRAYARAAARDPVAQKALGFFASHWDWSSLYKAYEVVRKDVGGAKAIAAHQWASTKEQDVFRRTANSYDVLGDEARHGVQTDEQPPPVPLSYDEARRFVRKVVKRWLDEVVVSRTTP